MITETWTTVGTRDQANAHPSPPSIQRRANSAAGIQW